MDAFSGKTVLITGASSGIGQAVALRIAAAGASVVLAARNQAALEKTVADIQAKGGTALAVPTDVTDPLQCERAVQRAVEHFGGLDNLICSAGVSLRATFYGTALTALEHVMRVNFFGTLYCTHHALPYVRARRGSLVAISSLTGKRGIPTYALYGASKCAIIGLYESLRMELEGDGVHVGVFCPGYVRTPLRQNVWGPDGKPWAEQPAPPFRVMSLRKCVDRLMNLILKRKPEAMMPSYTGPLLALDRVLGSFLGNAMLKYRFRTQRTSKSGRTNSSP
jgi:NAD(P)-dependent dehydrogenase (short-subunit alcohol dehydrogenase family)